MSSISPIYIEDDGNSAWHDIDVDLDEQSQRDFDTLELHYNTVQFEVPSRAVLEDQFAKADLLAMSRALRKQWLQIKAQWLEAIGSFQLCGKGARLPLARKGIAANAIWPAPRTGTTCWSGINYCRDLPSNDLNFG
jgi:hypothetical protein